MQIKIVAALCLLAVLGCSARQVAEEGRTSTLATFISDAVEEFQNQLLPQTLHAKSNSKNITARVLIKYLVPPPKVKDFVEAFEDVAEETGKEKGNRIYVLSKALTDNIVFYVYGEWDSQEDYFKHLKSDHVKKFLEFDQDESIIWNLIPLAAVVKED